MFPALKKLFLAMRSTPLRNPEPRPIEIARAHHLAGRVPEAEGVCRQLLDADPNDPDALNLLGVIAHQAGKHEIAVELIDKAIRRQPSNPKFLNNLGEANRGLRRLNEALACYREALAIEPGHVGALSNQGYVLQELKRYDEAIASYDKALAIKPDYAEGWNYRGFALLKLRRYDEAIASYRRALSIRPDHFEAHNNLGTALKGQGKLEEALASYRAALSLRPDLAEAHNNVGAALKEQGKLEQAIASYHKALSLRPEYAEAHYNLGAALKEQGKLEQAIASNRKALSLRPDFAEAQWNDGMCRLLLGDFERGWRQYEWRWKCDEFPSSRRNFSQALWLGEEDIAGKTVLLHAEQGLGDTIQFVRYAQEVARKGATVILEVPSVLRPLLSGLAGVHQVLSYGEQLPEFDFHCPLMSLPLALGTRLGPIPAAIPYLRAPAAKIGDWEGKLGQSGALKVGIVWSGNPAHRNDRNRSLALSRLIALQKPDVRLISLQKEVRPEDAGVLHADKRILHFGPQLEDFSDTAALVSLMDLVISVDTSIAHLAGALGKPVWILLPFAPDWRWQLDREDSPWYPTARLFRQSETGDWDGVIDKVKRGLSDF